MAEDRSGNGYVECDDCGHPLERHSRAGCDWQAEGCLCAAPWTVLAIREQRREAGLPVMFRGWHF